MKTGIHPIDEGELECRTKPWNPHFVAEVLSDVLSQQRGYSVKIRLTHQDEIARAKAAEK